MLDHGLARPAQIEAREAEENQHQGAGTGDMAAGITDGQKTVQLQHQVEKAQARDVALVVAGVRVKVAHLATALDVALTVQNVQPNRTNWEPD